MFLPVHLGLPAIEVESIRLGDIAREATDT